MDIESFKLAIRELLDIYSKDQGATPYEMFNTLEKLLEAKGSKASHFTGVMTEAVRVEVITDAGRGFVSWNENNEVELQYQGGGKTLKIFIHEKN